MSYLCLRNDIHTPTCSHSTHSTQYTHLYTQIEFLEVRLAEVMAYADIPPSMRPALSEYDAFAAVMGNNRGGRSVLAYVDL